MKIFVTYILSFLSAALHTFTFCMQELTFKKLTKERKDRKDIIVHRLFTERKLTKMILGFYSSVLPLLENFVLLFEMKQPLIHELYENQV